MPMPLCTQLIYAVTMLSRWARLLGPPKSPPSHSLPVPSDPSARPPHLTAGIMPVPGAGPTPSPSPSPLVNLQLRETADPGIPAAVASLREQLHSQPGLGLDIPAILAAMGARVEQANRELMETSSGGDRASNIWDLSAKKVMITRAKLDRWAEIVAAGGPEALITGFAGQDDENGRGEEGSEGSGSRCPRAEGSNRRDGYESGNGPGGQGGAGPVEGVYVDSIPIDPGLRDMGCVPGSAEAWQLNNLWGTDLFDGLDPNLWFDGTTAGDWAGVAVGSFGQ